MWNLELRTDAETGAQLDAIIAASYKGLWQVDKGSEAERTPQQRYADAITAAILNSSGRDMHPAGIRPEITVTVDHQWLIDHTNQFDPTYSSSGIAFTAATLRRLACDAAVLPAVLGGDSELLDLGRSKRTVSKAQRAALRLRDQRCVWPRCDATPDMCDGHHVRHWIWGGPTDLSNLVLLCHTHHRLCHEGGYEMWADSRNGGWNIHDSSGTPRFHTQTPRAGPGFFEQTG